MPDNILKLFILYSRYPDMPVPDAPSKAKIMLNPPKYPNDVIKRFVVGFLREPTSLIKYTPMRNTMKNGLIWAMQNCQIEKKEENAPKNASEKPTFKIKFTIS